jgi:hypothetical protein
MSTAKPSRIWRMARVASLVALLLTLIAWGISSRWSMRYHFGHLEAEDESETPRMMCVDGFAVRLVGGLLRVHGAGSEHRQDSAEAVWVTPLRSPRYGFDERPIVRGRMFSVDDDDDLGVPRGNEPAVEWEARIPLWIPSAVLAVLAVWLCRPMHRVSKGHCPKCNYDLTGNVSGRCPECGTAISTEVERTHDA